MILKRVQVEGYKALRNPVELKDLGLGIHLIHGPNETGKSTLVSAIARALFDRYNTQDQEIRALRPWGTELAPRVTLELEAAGKVYRLEKRFLDEESSALSEWNGSRFERVADSVKADDRVRGFLLGTAARSGASGLSNWGLARLLWMTQSHAARMSPPGLDETLRQHLLGTVGSAVLSDTEQKLLLGVDQAYDAFYTAAKGSEKKGGPLHEARERLARAEESLALWKSKWDEVSRWNESAIDAQARLGVIEADRRKLDSEMASLQARAREELELENLLKVKDQQLLTTLERWRALNSDHLEAQELERALKRHVDARTALEPRLSEGSAALGQLEARLAEATGAAQRASEESARLSAAAAARARDAELRALLRQKRDLAALEAHARELERELQARKDEYASQRRPKEADLDEARALKAELEGLRARIADQGIEVRVLPDRPGASVQWQSMDGTPLEPERTQEGAVFRSLDGGELMIPGFGRIAIRAGAGVTEGAGDSKKLKARLEEAQARLQAKLALYGTETLEGLQVFRAATSELETAGQALRTALNSTLQPRFKSVGEISAELARLTPAFERKLSEAGLTEATLTEEPASAAGDGAEPASAAGAAAAKTRFEQATRVRAALEAELRAMRRALDDERARHDAAKQGAELLGAQLEAKLASRGGREKLAEAVGAGALEKNSLEQERAALASRLPPAGERASGRLQELARRREEIGKREEAARKEFDQASALLAHAQGEGYYSKLAAAEEERAMASELLARRLSQAHGAKVLRALAHAKRERMNSNLLSPIEAAVTGIFREIRGESPSSRLSFGQDLDDLGVSVLTGGGGGGAGERSPLDTLSLGTQEQAMFALRLAFGDLLASRGEKPEPQLVVLDDPLVNADPARQERALEILRRAAAKLQILILTARPEDYRMLSPKEYDLSALKA